MRMRSARGVVCTPLDKVTRIGSVAPGVWNETCARQGSWYKASDKNGLYLVVSSIRLREYEDKRAATITLTDFSPPHLVTEEEKDALVRDPSFRKMIPSEWMQVVKRISASGEGNSMKCKP